VPRKAAAENELPRRRRRSAATAAVEENERGLVLRIFLHSPKDVIAGLLAFAGASAIVANALFLQHGPHPAPMFGTVVHIPQGPVASVSPLPRPRPAEAYAAPVEPRVAEPKPADLRLTDVKTVDPKSGDPLGSLVKATTGPLQPGMSAAASSTSIVLRPSASVPPVQLTGSHRVAAVQRALTEYGYGQLRATGTIDADTKAAIQKFELRRRLPVTGQVSDRLVHELVEVIGHPID
jgi:putative peptidoglycan binding protein